MPQLVPKLFRRRRVDEGGATAHPHLVCLVRRYSRGVLSPGRHVRTRLYFTSESHVHSLLSIFRYGSLLDVSPLKIRAAAFQTPSIRRDTVNGRLSVSLCVCVRFVRQEEKDQQWKRAMDYLSAVSELNYMTQIVIMLYEDNNKVWSPPPSAAEFEKRKEKIPSENSHWSLIRSILKVSSPFTLRCH